VSAAAAAATPFGTGHHTGAQGRRPDKGAFGGNAPDDIFGGQRPPGWRIVDHGVKAVPGPRRLSKTP